MSMFDKTKTDEEKIEAALLAAEVMTPTFMFTAMFMHWLYSASEEDTALLMKAHVSPPLVFQALLAPMVLDWLRIPEEKRDSPDDYFKREWNAAVERKFAPTARVQAAFKLAEQLSSGEQGQLPLQ